MRELIITPTGPADLEQVRISPEVRAVLIYNGWTPPGGPECDQGAPSIDIEDVRDPHGGCPCVLRLGHHLDATNKRHRCRCGMAWPRIELAARHRLRPFESRWDGDGRDDEP